MSNTELAARRVLNTQELVRIVVDFHSGAVNPSDKNKRDVAVLSTINRCFFQAATDVVWRNMYTILPYIRLLPPRRNIGKPSLSQEETRSQPTGPWTRFCVYSYKTKWIKLVEDETIRRDLPTHWFFYLFQHHSRPVLLFPNLTQLTIASMDGVNAVLPFHLLPTIKVLYLSDFPDRKGRSDTSKNELIVSLLTSLASGSSPSLWKMTLKPQLSKPMASILPQISTLTKLRIVLTSPPTSDELAFLNTFSSLEDLDLSLRGHRHSMDAYPQRGRHLATNPQAQVGSKIATLNLEGDPFFVFSTASLFASGSLHTFTAKIPAPMLPNRLRLGLFLVPHIFHLIAHHNPRLQQFSIDADQSLTIDEASWDGMESNDRVAIPDGLLPMIATLKDLRSLCLKHIPFLQADFMKTLLSRLPNSPCLQTLCLVPQLRPHVPSDLPNLDDLRTLSLKAPSLRHLTISLSLDLHPPNLPDLVIPGHGLRSLFITPQFTGLPRPEVSLLVPLVKYLDRVFPQLVDVTSYHEHKDSGSRGPGSLGVWRDIDHLLKSYQSLRKDMAAQLGQR